MCHNNRVTCITTIVLRWSNNWSAGFDSLVLWSLKRYKMIYTKGWSYHSRWGNEFYLMHGDRNRNFFQVVFYSCINYCWIYNWNPHRGFNIEIEYWLEQHKWQITVTGKSIFFFVINAGHLFPIYSAALLPFCRNSPCRLLFAKGGRKRGFLSFNGANHVLKAQNVPKDNFNFFLRRNPPTDFCDLSFIFLRFLFCFELAGGKRFPKHCRLLT